MLKYKTALTGASEIIMENPYASAVPSMARIVLISNTAFRGNITRNPYNFAHYNLSELSFTADGNDVGGEQFKLNFKQMQMLKQMQIR